MASRSRGVLRHLASAAVIAALCSLASHSVAEDHELRQAPDFRVRVAAALRLGKTGGTSARVELEAGLKDPHRAVRLACSAGLVSIADRAALPALEAAHHAESDAAVKTALGDAVLKLKTGGGHHEGGGSPPATVDHAKYVFALGTMKSSAHGGNFDGLMRRTARSKASDLHGAVVVERTEAELVKSATARKIPVLILDGTLTQLTQTGAGGSMTVSAQVNLAISTPASGLKGVVNGNGSATGGAVADLEERAVGAAVDGAVASVTRQIHTLTK